MSVAAGRPEPVMPHKHRLDPSKFDALIGELNCEYNLALKLEKGSTPTHSRERSRTDQGYARNYQICQGIRFLFFSSKPSLDEALSQFRSQSKAASIKWVPKPRADPDTLPRSSNPYRAVSLDEKAELQELLLRLINQTKAALPRPGIGPAAASNGTLAPGLASSDSHDPPLPPLPPSTPATGRHANFFDPSSPSRPKRRSPDAPDTSPSKRPRNLHSPNLLATTIDNVPARQKSFGPPAYNRSANTSKTSLGDTSVFSDNGCFPDTQTTQDASQEAKEVEALAAPAQELLPVPSETALAVDDSLSLFARRENNRSANNVPARGQGRESPPESLAVDSVYSSLPSEIDSDMGFDGEPGGHGLESRLASIWPPSPPWLSKAPFAVAWEITRAATHCGVDLSSITMMLPTSWDNRKSFDHVRNLLYQHEAFRGKAFPEKPSSSVWKATWEDFKSRDMIVQFSVHLDIHYNQTTPSLSIQMKPPRLEKSCRLNRHFGADRFVEVLMPSPGSNSPVKDCGELVHWLTRTKHPFVGRRWAAFFTTDAGYRTPLKEFRTSPDAKSVFKDRVQFFAESTIVPPLMKALVKPLPHQSVQDMLNWLLNFKKNRDQPYLKLFSRIQLGLSKTLPVIEFQPHQILHRKEDIRSPVLRKVMNDGIARMSMSVARKIRDAIGLSDIPCAVQARIGSAKGMWLVDVTDNGMEDWIETFPSQRKWNCDQSHPRHRSLEVHSIPSELKSASLNLQFLPVLENRALDKQLMRQVIGQRLVEDLNSELQDQESSMKNPLLFSAWVDRNAATRQQRVAHGQVPFLGGLPDKDEEVIMFLLRGGFHPMKQKYLQNLTFDLQKRKCDILKTKLNIRIKQSAYMYMVVDFLGVLEEGEVHIGFSTKFKGDDTTGTLLHGIDVLVARSPAHFVSDVQRVKAVFRPELQALKDVVVFSTKGSVPLADKLSGGDYDGDRAWVCWDADIVDNFVNADVPEPPDLSPYLKKDKTTLGDLWKAQGNSASAISEMLERSFEFNTRRNFLGSCTNYKERLCYHTGRVDDEASIILSKLLSDLVDQAKQGFTFTQEDWNLLVKDVLQQRPFFEDPAYKKESWQGRGDPKHIIDYLKFTIAKPTIYRGLAEFQKAIDLGPEKAYFWDTDLAKYYTEFDAMGKRSESSRLLLLVLKDAIKEVHTYWKETAAKDFTERVNLTYEKWCGIQPSFYLKNSKDTATSADASAVSREKGSRAIANSKVVSLLKEPCVDHQQLTRWALLRASTAFKLYGSGQSRFLWQMAGRELQFIKTMTTKGGDAKEGGVEGPPIPVAPQMYAALMTDKKFVRQFSASLDGGSSDYFGEVDSDAEEDDT